MAKPIKISILGDVSDLSRALGKGSKDLDTFGAKAARIGKRVAKMGAVVGSAGLAVGGALYKVGETFSDVSNTIIVGTGASGAALEALEDSAKKVGKTTPSSFADIGTAIADVNTRLGLTGKPLEDMTSRFLNLSRITGTDLQANITNASRVFGDWGIAVKDQPDALDAIFEATKRTGIGLDALTNNVVQFGAPLRQFGFDFEESLALFGKWEKEGVNTQVVLSGLKQALGRFSDAGKDPEKELARVTAAIKGAGSAGEANAIAIEAFGMRAGPDMAAAVREGRFELGDMADALKSAGGSIEDADKRTRTMAEGWKILTNKVLVLLEPIATRVFDAVAKGMDKLSAWWDRHGDEVVSGVKRLGQFFRDLGETVAEVADWVKRNWDTIKTATIVTAAILAPIFVRMAIQWAFVGTAAKKSALAQVIAWATAKAAAIKGAAVYVLQTYKVIAGWALMSAKAVLHGLKIAAVWTAQVVAAAVKGAAAFAVQVARVVAGWALMGAKALLHAAKMAAAWVIAMGPVGWVIAAVVGLVALIIANWTKVKKWTAAAFGAVVGAVKSAIRWMVNAFLNWTLPGLIIKHWATIKRVFSEGVAAAVRFVRSLPGKIKGFFSGAASWLVSAGRDLLSGLWRGISNAAGWLRDKVLGWAGGLLDSVKSFFGISSPSKVMADQGAWIAKGLGLGIEKNAGAAVGAALKTADAVSAALAVQVPEVGMGDVLARTLPAGPSGTAAAPRSSALTRQGDQGGPGGAPVYHVNVNVQGSKSSARDIADETVWALKTSGR